MSAAWDELELELSLAGAMTLVVVMADRAAVGSVELIVLVTSGGFMISVMCLCSNLEWDLFR